MYSNNRDLVDGTSVARRIAQAATERTLNFQWGRVLMLLTPAAIATLGIGWLAWENIGKKDLMNSSPVVPIDKLHALATKQLRYTTSSTNGVKTPMFIRVCGWVRAESASVITETNKANKVISYTETTYRLASLPESLYPAVKEEPSEVLASAKVSLSLTPAATNIVIGYSNSLGISNIGSTIPTGTLASLTIPPAMLESEHPEVPPTIQFTRRRLLSDYEHPFEVMPKLGDAPQSIVVTLPNHPERFTRGRANTLSVKPLQVTSAQEAEIEPVP